MLTCVWSSTLGRVRDRRAGDLAGRQPTRLLYRHRLSGHGFDIGPGAGQLMADLVTGGPPPVDPGPFRSSRFAAGDYPPPSALVT